MTRRSESQCDHADFIIIYSIKYIKYIKYMILLFTRKREAGLTAGSGFLSPNKFNIFKYLQHLYYLAIIFAGFGGPAAGSFRYCSGEDSTISFERRQTLIAKRDLIEDRFDPEFNQSC